MLLSIAIPYHFYSQHQVVSVPMVLMQKKQNIMNFITQFFTLSTV